MIFVKKTSASGTNWYVYHRSGTASGYTAEQSVGFLNLTDAWVNSTGAWNDTAPTASQFTVGSTNSTDGATYIAYLFAHDDSATGLIQCGAFNTDGGGNATITLGWEPQYLLLKGASGTGWYIVDSARGFMAAPATTDPYLYTNSSAAEASIAKTVAPNATGFSIANWGENFIYLAIRRGPMKLPTSGTQVYNAIARTGTGAATTVTGVGFPPDFLTSINRTHAATNVSAVFDRLRGINAAWLNLNGTQAENGASEGMASFNMDGVSLILDGTTTSLDQTYINHFFRRYPGVFDEVCYKGTGSAHNETHNLGVAPELWLVKVRSGSTGAWRWGCTSVGANKFTKMPSDGSGWETDTTMWNNTLPTASAFSVGTAAGSNNSGSYFVAYLFATLAGISKVGSYTGNGSTQTLNCGFTAGARFILIIRTDGVIQTFFVWDSTRGIISGNDPYLDLGTTAAEVTGDDSVDPDNSGLIVNEIAATHINVNNATYIYLAFA